MSEKVLFGLRLTENRAISMTLEPFSSHKKMIEDGKRYLDEGLWSSDPVQQAAFMKWRQHPRRVAAVMHMWAVVLFVFEMLASLIPIPSFHRHTVGQLQTGARGVAKVFFLRWLRFRFALSHVVWEK